MTRKRTQSSLKIRAYTETGGQCFYCRKALAPFGPLNREGPNSTTIDHVIPVSLGGLGSFANVVLSCRKCNEVKSDWIIPGYIWRDTEQLLKLLATGECKWGKTSECCGTNEDFKPRTKQELTEILWGQKSLTSSNLNHSFQKVRMNLRVS